MKSDISEIEPVFYGSATVGERGQLVIPAEARKGMDITPADKLLVLGSPQVNMLIMVKAEHLTGFMSKMTGILKQFKE